MKIQMNVQPYVDVYYQSFSRSKNYRIEFDGDLDNDREYILVLRDDVYLVSDLCNKKRFVKLTCGLPLKNMDGE